MVTQRECLAQAMKDNGYVQVASKSSKYLTFTKEGGARNYFIGKSGGLRFGRTTTESTSVLESVRLRLLEAGRKALKESK